MSTKRPVIRIAAVALTLLGVCLSAPAAALEGEPYIHDPSTVAYENGKYYVFGTGSGGLISDDGGWTWHGGAVRPGGGVAPDVIKIGDRFWMSYAAGGGGMSGGHASNVHVMWSTTLDPKSPDFGFHDDTVVARTNGIEDADAIDPSFLYAQGHLWISYGTYFGFTRVLELDPRTGKALGAGKPVDVAIDMEATDLIYRDGWYYLLGTHGTCCDGANSTYNIRVGRSRKPTGPYVDNMGIPLLKGGGKLVVAASGRHIGPGHFGRLILGDGVEKFSCHYEADLDRSGRSVLDIRPLLWKDGWPVGGDNFVPGTYEIQSERSGGALELGVDFVRMPGSRGGFGFGRNVSGPVVAVPNQQLAQVQPDWPAGNLDIRLDDYMVRPNQQWTITPVPDVGGYLGQPFFKITIAGTERALASTPDGQLVATPAYDGSPAQLWQIDQLTDGTYRIQPKVVPNPNAPVALTAIGASTPTLARFDPGSDASRWSFRTP
jgi:arabinan endo-1,5-alpha-L-arabinosidase